MATTGTHPYHSRIEQIDDRIRRAREIVQRSKHVIIDPKAGFIEPYIGGKIYFGLRRALPDKTQYGLTL